MLPNTEMDLIALEEFDLNMASLEAMRSALRESRKVTSDMAFESERLLSTSVVLEAYYTSPKETFTIALEAINGKMIALIIGAGLALITLVGKLFGWFTDSAAKTTGTPESVAAAKDKIDAVDAATDAALKETASVLGAVSLTKVLDIAGYEMNEEYMDWLVGGRGMDYIIANTKQVGEWNPVTAESKLQKMIVQQQNIIFAELKAGTKTVSEMQDYFTMLYGDIDWELATAECDRYRSFATDPLVLTKVDPTAIKTHLNVDGVVTKSWGKTYQLGKIITDEVRPYKMGPIYLRGMEIELEKSNDSLEELEGLTFDPKDVGAEAFHAIIIQEAKNVIKIKGVMVNAINHYCAAVQFMLSKFRLWCKYLRDTFKAIRKAIQIVEKVKASGDTTSEEAVATAGVLCKKPPEAALERIKIALDSIQKMEDALADQ